MANGLITANQFQLTPDLMQGVRGFHAGQNIANQFQLAQMRKAEAPVRQQLMQQQIAAGERQAEQEQIAMAQAEQQENIRNLSIAADTLRGDIEAGNIQGAASKLPELAKILPPDSIKDLEQNLVTGNIEAIKNQISMVDSLRAQMTDQAKAADDTANIRDFEYWQTLKETDPEGAKMFAKDVGLVPKDKPISPVSEKNLIDAQEKYFESSKNSREYSLLADDFKRFESELPAGTALTVSDFLANVTGSQGEAEELRRRFSTVRLSQALRFLPPGPATDRDVEEAFKGVPRENASPEQVIMFLRGASKMAAIEAEFQEFKAGYIGKKDGSKGLIQAWKKHIEEGNSEAINALTPSGELDQKQEAVKQAKEPSIEDLVNKYGN